MSRFSIVIPCYNAESTIGATLDALTAQTFTDWEAIIVDDGSTDGTPEIVKAKSRNEPRLRAVANTGKGPSEARNYGALTEATGEIVAFCDADDIWSPTKLSELDAAFADTDISGAFGRIAFFCDTPADTRVLSTVPTVPLSIAMLLGENPVCTMSNIAVRRDAFRQTGGFAADMVHNEDLDWLIRLVGGGAKVVGLASTQVWYRTSTGGLSANLGAMRAGRVRALESARRFGVKPGRDAEAIHFRYLTRRALRLDLGVGVTLGLCVRGLLMNPASFLTPARRGVPTAIAAFASAFLPRAVRHALFTR